LRLERSPATEALGGGLETPRRLTSVRGCGRGPRTPVGPVGPCGSRSTQRRTPRNGAACNRNLIFGSSIVRSRIAQSTNRGPLRRHFVRGLQCTVACGQLAFITGREGARWPATRLSVSRRKRTASLFLVDSEQVEDGSATQHEHLSTARYPGAYTRLFDC
jgi:hypothetical protein